MKISMNIKNKILLFGGEGFIGRNIAAELTTGSSCFSLGTKETIFNLDRVDVFIKGNPYEDKINEKFDVYVHLIDNQVADDDFEKEELKLIENIGFIAGSHLIIFSSAVIYANPDSPYAKRKIKLEDIYENYCAKHNINLTIFRLFNIYGKFQIPYRQGSLIANILFNYQNDIKIEINDMNAERDFIYAGDMAKLVRWVIENKFYGKIDLATGKLISIMELLSICKDNIFSKDVDIIDKNNIESNVCPLGNSFLSEKTELIPLKDGLTETLNFYEQNLNVIKKYLNI